MEATNIKQARPSKKLSDKCVGPYTILEKRGEASWKVDMPGIDKRYPVFNESLLTPYRQPPAHRRDERPAPEIIDDEPEYEVEKILKHRKAGRGYQYWIKWRGYPNSENTWEPRRNLERAKEILDAYDKAHNIHIRNVPIVPENAWIDQYAPRYKAAVEKRPYPKQLFFLPRTGQKIDITAHVSDRDFVHRQYANLRKSFNDGLLQKDDPRIVETTIPKKEIMSESDPGKQCHFM